jgi:signal transduction histidine kinase
MGAGQLSKAHLVLPALDTARLRSQKALGLCLLIICSGLLALPFMVAHTPRADSFILVVDTAFATLVLVVSLLLFAQVPQKRSPALLALASGFLFMGLATLPQLLGIWPPGSFDPQLRLTIDLALPLAVIAYVLKRRPERPVDFNSDRSAALIGRAVAATFALALLTVWLVSAGDPQGAFPDSETASSVRNVLATAFLAIVFGTAIGVIWRHRHAPFDLWLLVGLTAWVVAVLIQGISPMTSFAWHFAQLYPLLAVGCLLLALLPEETAANPIGVERQNRPVVPGTTLDAVANELSQPLCAISANAEAIARLLPVDVPEEVRAALADITEDAQRISRTMSTAQRLLAGAHEAPGVIDVGQLLNESVLQLQPELQEHAVVCEVETAPHLPGIRGLRKPLLQLLVNLLTNSLEAMSWVNSRERRLTVRASRHDSNAVVISIQDSGVGIQPEDAVRVFEPFFTTKPRRSGLGLAVCRSIADAHGGAIELTPAEGCGTAIKVILPSS